MKTECPNCDRWYDLPTEPGDYACETCGRKYHISRTSTTPQLVPAGQSSVDTGDIADNSLSVTHHCPNCEQTARELADMRARLDKLADRWDSESVAEYKHCASELENLLAETEGKK